MVWSLNGLARATTYTRNQIIENKITCQTYSITLCKELVNRMPKNLDLLKKCNNFALQLVLSTTKKPKITALPLDLLENEDADEIDSQFRSISNVSWSAKYDEKVLYDYDQFWCKVYNYATTKDDQTFTPYRQLEEFALKVRTMPISNAVVERVFSIMNAVKSKLRNRMSLPMLDAISRIRMYFYSRKICCTSFVPSQGMYNRFNKGIYEGRLTTGPASKTHRPKDAGSKTDEQEAQEILTLFAGEDFGDDYCDHD